MAFNGNLYPFQQVTRNWLAERDYGLVAHPMGTGKSVISIATLEALEEANALQGRVLVVPPAPLKYQWAEQIKRFTDKDVAVVAGKPAERLRQWQSQKPYTVANYEIFLKDDAPYYIDWAAVILDEASRLKGRGKTFKQILKLKSQRRYVLTGTPVENSVKEIYPIFAFMNPRILGSYRSFQENFLDTRLRSYGNKQWVDIVGFKNLNYLRTLISPHFIRHEKNYIQMDLPKVIEDVREFDMLWEQTQMYYDISHRTLSMYKDLQQLIMDGEPEELVQKVRSRILTGIMFLRECTISTQLVNRSKSESRDFFVQKTYLDQGNKIDEALNLIRDMRGNGDKIVVFSCFRNVVDILSGTLDRSKIPYVKFVGGMSPEQKTESVHKFKNDPDITAFIATDAGAYGVDGLQVAQYCVHVDIPWNPGVLDQRNGRIERSGQQNDNVEIIYLVSRNSFDRKMFEAVKSKREIFSKLIGNTQEDITFNLDQIMKVVGEASVRSGA